MREDILDKVLKVLNANLENTEITFEQIEDDLSALGMDSIEFIRDDLTEADVEKLERNRKIFG